MIAGYLSVVDTVQSKLCYPITQFRAGRFVDSDIPVPPNPHTFAYRNDTRKQIERIHEGVILFISTISSLLQALSSCYSRKHPSSVAIIDLHKAEKVEEYEDDDNFFIQNVYHLNLKPGHPYKGINEVRVRFRFTWQNLIMTVLHLRWN